MEKTAKLRIAVTGGSGKAGRACVADLLAHGYDVVNIDSKPPAANLCPSLSVDLTDFGQTMDALASAGLGQAPFHAVAHFAAIPAPRQFSDAVTFQNNMMSTYNVFEAARRLGIKNVVWASSETVLGLPFDTPPPYVPVDEEYPGRPESAYSLSKLLGEEMAAQYCRWDPAMKIIGLRFSNVMDLADYAAFPDYEKDPQRRKWNLWGYIDARDAAQATRKAIEADLKGAEVFIIANEDTVVSRTNDELLAQFFPDMPIKQKYGPNETLLSIEKARRVLGYAPQHSWRK